MQLCSRVAFFILLISFLINPAYSQLTRVTGKVIDAQSKELIPFASIYFSDKSKGTVSDFEGNFIIETSTGPDSLIVTSVGYSVKKLAIQKYQVQQINILLEEEVGSLNEITVSVTENPAYRIIRNVISNKKNFRRETIKSYSYESYNKSKIGLRELDEDLKKQFYLKPFAFFFENMDTTDGKPYLPVMLLETVSDNFYQKDGNKQKEIIKATRLSGMKNESIGKLFSNLALNVYVYDDFLLMFNKNFISPVSSSCFRHYDYELLDSGYVDNNWCYKVRYFPSRKQELTLSGIMWVRDSTFTIKEIDAKAGQEINLNFVTSFGLRQTYMDVESKSLTAEEQLYIYGEVLVPHSGKTQKFFASRSTSNKNFNLNPSFTNSFFDDKATTIVEKEAGEKDNSYWESVRHDTLSNSEQALYHLTDSLKNTKAFKRYLVLFKGYIPVKKIEFGPIYKVYSYNPVEGNKFRLGFRTNPKLSRRILLDGYGAYGLRDEKIKYGAGITYFRKKDPDEIISFRVKHDIEQLGFSQVTFMRPDNLLNALFKISAQNRLNFIDEYKLYYEKFWTQHLSNKLQIRNATIRPVGKLEYNKETPGTNDTVNVSSITTTEVSIYTHYAYKEKFLRGDYRRISLGTPYPVFDAAVVLGIKNLLGSNYSYQKIALSVRQRLRIKNIGYTRYRAEAGKIFGTLPYPLLELHNGNQTIFYDDYIFNSMRFFEFVSDQYVNVQLSHHFDGYFFNKIPLIRKLKWREVISFKGVMGSLSDKNKAQMVLLPEMYSLAKEPFLEAGVGIENIFRVIRLDGIWRLNYHDHPGTEKFYIKLSVHIDF